MEEYKNLDLNSLKRNTISNIHKGIYFLYDNDELVYIGRSYNVFDRVSTHAVENIKTFNNYSYILTDDINDIEKYMIYKYKPKYNVMSMRDYKKEMSKELTHIIEHEDFTIPVLI